MAGKGSRRRPCKISKQEADLRFQLAFGSPEQKADAKKKLADMGVVVR